MKSIKFYGVDVKAIVTKKSRVAFCENSQKKRNVIIEILSINFTSNIFELHERKTGGKRKA